MKKLPQAPKQKNPVMIDRALAYIQDELINRLGWLNYAFGRAQRLVTKRERKEYYYPGVYIGKNEYINVLPGQGLRNRSFFIVSDPQNIGYNPRRYNTISVPCALIVWYDLTSIYPGQNERNTEEIKRQLLRAITNMTYPDNTRFAPAKIYEQAENIFREYSLKEIDTQYLMQPYAGIRIDGELKFTEDCK